MAQIRAAVKVPGFTCGGCLARWTPLNAAHCSACHRTFTGITMFDKHRNGGQCVDPRILKNPQGEIVMRLNDSGLWRDAKENTHLW